MTETFRPLQDHQVRLLPGLFKKRFDINRRYIISLETQNLAPKPLLGSWTVGTLGQT